MHTSTVYPEQNCANRQKARLIQLRENIIPRQWPDHVCRRAQGNVVRIAPWSESHSFSAHRVVRDWRITLSNALAPRASPEVRIARSPAKRSLSAETMFVDRLKFKSPQDIRIRNTLNNPRVGREAVPAISSGRKVSIHDEAPARVLYGLGGNVSPIR